MHGHLHKEDLSHMNKVGAVLVAYDACRAHEYVCKEENDNIENWNEKNEGGRRENLKLGFEMAPACSASRVTN